MCWAAQLKYRMHHQKVSKSLELASVRSQREEVGS